jgi:predicted PolB exonuclease-like 3'-5' exonuclease
MKESVMAWDLETVPDLSAARRMLNLPEANDIEVREALGEGFPKLPLHKIVCIGALIAEFDNAIWNIRALGAPHIGERTEAQLITGFVDKIAESKPQLVSFNGNSFDLPVLRYRAMLHQLPAPGLAARPYYHRYTEDALDLCDALSSFDGRLKLKLGDLCQTLGMRGKSDGIDGSQVEQMVAEGRISDVAAYCECDVVCTYEIWLRYRLFRGTLSAEAYEASRAALLAFLSDQSEKKPHLGQYRA